MTYCCRVIKPALTAWSETTALSPGEAAQDFYYHDGYYRCGITYMYEIGPSKFEQIKFAMVEVEGHGYFVVRVYYFGIYRMGGSPRTWPTLDDVARRLGWTKATEELIASNWEYEEQ